MRDMAIGELKRICANAEGCEDCKISYKGECKLFQHPMLWGIEKSSATKLSNIIEICEKERNCEDCKFYKKKQEENEFVGCMFKNYPPSQWDL